MKITMKKTITLATAVVLTLAFGVAYADDEQLVFMNNNDTGTVLYNAFLKHDADIAKGSAAGGVRAEAAIQSDIHTIDQVLFMGTKDTGTELREDYLKQEADIGKGSATGGVRGGNDLSSTLKYISPSWDSMPTMFPQR
jgi:hypothetical protein